MKMAKKKKLENLKKKHNRYIKSLGVNIDVDTGEIFSSFEGYDFPDLSCRPSLPTSDKIADAKDDLITFRDKIQDEIDQFDKWAETQSDIDTSIQLEVDKALRK